LRPATAAHDQSTDYQQRPLRPATAAPLLPALPLPRTCRLLPAPTLLNTLPKGSTTALTTRFVFRSPFSPPSSRFSPPPPPPPPPSPRHPPSPARSLLSPPPSLHHRLGVTGKREEEASGSASIVVVVVGAVGEHVGARQRKRVHVDHDGGARDGERAAGHVVDLLQLRPRAAASRRRLHRQPQGALFAGIGAPELIDQLRHPTEKSTRQQ